MLRQRSVCKTIKKKTNQKKKTRNIYFQRLPILQIKVAWNRFPRHLLTIFKALKKKSFLLHSRTSFTHLLTNGFKFEMAGVLWQSLLWCERYLEIPWNSFWSRAWKILARFSHSFTNTFLRQFLLSEFPQTEVILPIFQTSRLQRWNYSFKNQFKISEFLAVVCLQEDVIQWVT